MSGIEHRELSTYDSTSDRRKSSSVELMRVAQLGARVNLTSDPPVRSQSPLAFAAVDEEDGSSPGSRRSATHREAFELKW